MVGRSEDLHKGLVRLILVMSMNRRLLQAHPPPLREHCVQCIWSPSQTFITGPPPHARDWTLRRASPCGCLVKATPATLHHEPKLRELRIVDVPVIVISSQQSSAELGLQLACEMCRGPESNGKPITREAFEWLSHVSELAREWVGPARDCLGRSVRSCRAP